MDHKHGRENEAHNGPLGIPLIIITGLSGAGKSTAMRVFEDLGYYCLDNLPPGLIGDFFSLYAQSAAGGTGVAIASDVRSGALFDDFQGTVSSLRDDGIKFAILYLDCVNEVLINRFNEVRRTHPLQPQYSLLQAIEKERERLQPILAIATHVIDTSRLNPASLRSEVIHTVTAQDAATVLHLKFVSFGFKYGAPRDADFVLDVRFLPNPFYVTELKNLNGEDDPVYNYVMNQDCADGFFEKVTGMLDQTLDAFIEVGKFTLTVGVGCTGGKHRSVAFARRLVAHYDQLGRKADAVHRDLTRTLQ